MLMFLRRFLLSIYILGGIALSANAQDVDVTLLLAENGSPIAQNDLGYMYFYGDGVREDLTESVKWYRKSAAQGNAEGQYMLGIYYYQGYGVPKNYVRAYLWISLAAARGDETAKDKKPQLAKLMTSAQVTEATWLSLECYKANFKGCE